MAVPIAALILTRDEAPNIARTLAQLAFAAEIVVVDSGGPDATRQLAAAHPRVRVVERAFTTHAEQWNYGLQQTGITADWVLALDADFVLTDEAAAEISSLDPPAAIDGYWASFQYCIGGRPLRGAAYPPVVVLYRRARAHYEQDGHTQRVQIKGRAGHLRGRIQHDDRKPLAQWLWSQTRYMRLEAEKLDATTAASSSWPDRLRRLLVLAPPAMFVYCYVVRLGVLDGWPGLYYALQRATAEAILSLHLLERRLRRERRTGDRP